LEVNRGLPEPSSPGACRCGCSIAAHDYAGDGPCACGCPEYRGANSPRPVTVGSSLEEATVPQTAGTAGWTFALSLNVSAQ
jgi:hypothetical protein